MTLSYVIKVTFGNSTIINKAKPVHALYNKPFKFGLTGDLIGSAWWPRGAIVKFENKN